jgi:hypothetical protein
MSPFGLEIIPVLGTHAILVFFVLEVTVQILESKCGCAEANFE